MDAFQLDIVRFLTTSARYESRATYQEVAEAVGWGHPTGRGLGKHLEVILRELHERKLPPLTTILVKKGEKYPHDDAMAYINAVLGDIDLDTAQRQVFDFDWVSCLKSMEGQRLPSGRDFWLTSFWGFDPDDWGCIGFADEARRTRFIRQSSSGTIVAIYVTKRRGPEKMRGKIVGFLELSHEIGHAKNFISGDRWAEKETNPETKGKWPFAVRATRAWRIIPEDHEAVEKVLPLAYSSTHAEIIGSSGVKVSDEEVAKLLELNVYEVPVYKQTNGINSGIASLGSSLTTSRAIPPPKEPYWVGETDGPKYLYILQLGGDTAAYLGKQQSDVEGMGIIKVGFSKSPLARRDQIQSAYPAGAFKWQVLYPSASRPNQPYENAAVAIEGEDAMKKRLIDEGAIVLGGEFFLAEDWLIHKTWSAGKYAADEAQKREKEKPVADKPLAQMRLISELDHALFQSVSSP